MTKLSLAHLSMIDATPLELIEAAAAAGLDGVGLRVASSSTLPGGIDLTQDAAALRAVKNRLSSHGLKVFDVEAFGLTARTEVAGFARALDVSAELGAGKLLCVGHDEDPIRLRDNFGRLCDLAAERNIQVGLEFIPYAIIKTLGQALDLLKRADHRNAALLLDVLHLSRSGGEPEDLASLSEEAYAFVQICDARLQRPPYEGLPNEARTDRLAPGKGDLWLDRLMPLLPPLSHLSIEAPVAEAAHLPFAERARALADATRLFLARFGN